MKKLSFALACAASVAVFAGDPINSIGFEDYAAGFTGLTLKTDAGVEGAATASYWLYDGSGDGSVVKAYGAEGNLSAPTGSNLSGTPGLNYLELSTEGGTLWRSIKTLAGATSLGTAQEVGADGADGLYVDTMVQFTPTEDGGTPEVARDPDDENTYVDKLAIWLNVDSSGAEPKTNLCALARSYDMVEGDISNAAATFVLEPADGSKLSIDAGTWYRLTVKATKIVDDESFAMIAGFRIFVDGRAMRAKTAPVGAGLAEAISGMLGANAALVANKELFPSLQPMGNGGDPLTLQGVGFKGSGAIDELVFTETNPLPAPEETLDFSIAAGAMTAVEWSADDGTTWTTYESGAKAAAGNILVRFKNGDGVTKTVTKTIVAGETNAFDVSAETFGWVEYLGEAVEGAYTIDDATDLGMFQKGVAAGLVTAGETFKLTHDIALTEAWPGIGTYNVSANPCSFQGTFDGQGYKISNVVMADTGSNNYRGFFNQIYQATVQNLTVATTGFGANPPSGEYGTAAIVGYAFDSSVIGCTAEGTIASGTHNVGGIAVRVRGSTLQFCTNKVNITGNYTKVAGIAVLTQNEGAGETTLIEGCVNEGNITCANGTNAGRDGCAGILAYIGTPNVVTIKDCENKGTIAKGTGCSASAKTGQIVAYYYKTAAFAGANKGTADQLMINTIESGQSCACHVATVDGSVATLIADSAVAVGGFFKVMAPGYTPTIVLAAGESISFDTALATITDTGITAATGAELTTDKTTAVWTYSAAAPAPAYPTYIGDNTEKQGWYDVWKGTYAEDSDSSKEEQFLLDIAPAADAAAIAAAKAAFKITAIEPDGKGGWTVTVAGDKGDGDRYGNGRIEIQGATTLNGPWAKNTAGAKFFKAVLK